MFDIRKSAKQLIVTQVYVDGHILHEFTTLHQTARNTILVINKS